MADTKLRHRRSGWRCARHGYRRRHLRCRGHEHRAEVAALARRLMMLPMSVRDFPDDAHRRRGLRAAMKMAAPGVVRGGPMVGTAAASGRRSLSLVGRAQAANAADARGDDGDDDHDGEVARARDEVRAACGDGDVRLDRGSGHAAGTAAVGRTAARRASVGGAQHRDGRDAEAASGAVGVSSAQTRRRLGRSRAPRVERARRRRASAEPGASVVVVGTGEGGGRGAAARSAAPRCAAGEPNWKGWPVPA